MVDKTDGSFNEVGFTGTRAGFDDCGARAGRNPVEDCLLFGRAVGDEGRRDNGRGGEGDFHAEMELMRCSTEDSSL